jgi:hypothetical protein
LFDTSRCYCSSFIGCFCCCYIWTDHGHPS